MRKNVENGTIEIITGPMFAGKSSELIKRLTLYKIAKFEPIIFKPALDTRFSDSKIVSRTGSTFPAISINEPKEVLSHIDEKTEVIAFDEIQFFDKKIITIIEKLANKGIHIIISGLDMDFEGNPFENVAKLMAIADKVDKLKAVCMVCYAPAGMSFRKIDSKLRTVIGDDIYEARCRFCHKNK
ncbi:thymidine kinase [Mycoplasmopsis gallinacea]|uniref:Thymidine kinase n=1 Tax=Mycoplasmopsis gallinacea TaxID=29556 RepID=A0A449A3L9_9BACT|nr:thymidine kinase [Mycoplasmopsis gallinacea]VEU58846.1 Thymidine kinase [Mycoplasmopsis gallinacea]